MPQIVSPGGFEFGIQGWDWGEQRAKSITFFLDGTAMVCDQHGRPIRGSVHNNKEVLFAITAPDLPNGRPASELTRLGNHADIIAALRADRYEWTTMSHAGWPQIPYEELKKIAELPPTPLEELRKIRNPLLRKDAIKMWQEADAKAKELVQLNMEV